MKMKICNFFNISFRGPNWYVTGALIFADHKNVFSYHIYVIVVEKWCILWNCLEFFPLLRIAMFCTESGGCVWKSYFQLKCRISFMSQGKWRQFKDSYSIIFLWQFGMIIIIVLRKSPVIKFIQHWRYRMFQNSRCFGNGYTMLFNC